MSLKLSIANGIASVVDYALRVGGARLHRHVVQTMFSRLPQTLLADYDLDNLEVAMLLPSYVQPDPSDRLMVERIFAAFQKAKLDQKEKSEIFMPSSLWEKHLDASYPSYPDTDIDRFHFFLSNFGSLDTYTGINFSTLVREYAKTAKSRKHFEKMVIGLKVAWWLRFESNGRDLSALSIPQHGNQCGATVNNNFIGFDSVLNEFYGRMISNFLKKDRPVVGEIGAGYGILFFFISRALSDYCYLDFDLPETLCCATYYLMKSFPHRKFLLYGESELNEKVMKEYDFIFMPSYAIKDLPDDSVDIFINMSSLGEIKPQACKMFIGEICRTAHAFWHMNHEYRRNVFEDSTTSLLNGEYPVPDEKFDLVIRYIDALNAAYKGIFDRGYDIYGYYYTRK